MLGKLVVVILVSMILAELLDGRIPRKKKIKKAKEKALKKHLNKLTADWTKSWEESQCLPKQKLTKRQRDYWRQLAEYNEDGTTMGPVSSFRRDIRILNRMKREGPLINRTKTNRVEWRHMTASRKAAFIRAVNRLAAFIPDQGDPGTSAYDIFVQWHRRSNSPGAHLGASFLPWHREYLWRCVGSLITFWLSRSKIL